MNEQKIFEELLFAINNSKIMFSIDLRRSDFIEKRYVAQVNGILFISRHTIVKNTNKCDIYSLDIVDTSISQGKTFEYNNNPDDILNNQYAPKKVFDAIEEKQHDTLNKALFQLNQINRKLYEL